MKRIPEDQRRVRINVRVRPDVLAYLRSHDGLGVGEVIDQAVDCVRGMERRYGVQPLRSPQ